MNPNLIIILVLFWNFLATACYAQKNKEFIDGSKEITNQPDTVFLLKDQATLFVSPKKHLLTTHFDFTVGASRVAKDDKDQELGFAATVKGLYMSTGAIYFNMGLGISRLSSKKDADIPFKHIATNITLPIGIGFSIGDDRAQIFNSIDFLPVYYVDAPYVDDMRQFAVGVGVDLGFYIRIRQRLHLGMMAKFQMFQPYDKADNQTLMRYGFLGTGLLLRYD